VLRGALDGAPSEIASAADDEGEAFAVGVGDGGETVPEEFMSED